MKVLSDNLFRVKTKDLLDELKNLKIDYTKQGNVIEFRKVYGYLDDQMYCSENSLFGRLENGMLRLMLSSEGGMCGFEFDTDSVFPYEVTCLGELFDLELMTDVKTLLQDSVVESEEK